VKRLMERIDARQPELNRLDAYWAGRQPAAFLSSRSREALDQTLQRMAVNIPRLAVESLVERLTVVGWQIEGEHEANPALWTAWRRSGMEDLSAQVHADALVYGRSFVIVWADSNSRPTISVESPQQVAVDVDPLTREVRAAVKRWEDDGDAHAVLYLPDAVLHMEHPAWSGSGMPTTGWRVTERLPNPLGVVPVVPFTNRGRLAEAEGVSEMEDLLPLADGLNKLTADALVTSEHYARPRRWATGLELQEDEQGEVINPFSSESDRLWTSEQAEARFGQFEPASMTGYTDMIATMTQMLGALSGLPPHYLGLNGDQPPSADSIRSAEASLVSRATALQRTMGRSWARVAAMVQAVLTAEDPLAVDVTTLWASAETRTPAQQTDSAQKLTDMGVPLSVVLSKSLDWAPEEIRAVSAAQRSEALNRAAFDLTAALQQPQPSAVQEQTNQQPQPEVTPRAAA